MIRFHLLAMALLAGIAAPAFAATPINSTRSGAAERTRLETPSDERCVLTSKPYEESERSASTS